MVCLLNPHERMLRFHAMPLLTAEAILNLNIWGFTNRKGFLFGAPNEKDYRRLWKSTFQPAIMEIVEPNLKKRQQYVAAKAFTY